MSRAFKISFAAAALLAAFIIVCRLVTPLADFYALHIYPSVSAVLSLISSPVHFSVQGITVIIFVLAAIFIIVRSARHLDSWKKCLAREAHLLLWIFVWFYLGWCVNYSRSSIFQRLETGRPQYDSTAFVAFLDNFTEQLNASYTEDKSVDLQILEKEIKTFYSSVPKQYGLSNPKDWQHPKRMTWQGYFSATGILGYMGPLFDEFHINEDLLPEQLPFTLAHEYSHLLGVSSEAEANWWAWNACHASALPAIRYSAFQSMLSYVLSNAHRILSEEDFAAWRDTIKPEIISDLIARNNYWLSKRNKNLDKIQSTVYDIFLKSNNIPSGTKNYSEVIQLLLAIDY